MGIPFWELVLGKMRGAGPESMGITTQAVVIKPSDRGPGESCTLQEPACGLQNFLRAAVHRQSRQIK